MLVASANCPLQFMIRLFHNIAGQYKEQSNQKEHTTQVNIAYILYGPINRSPAYSELVSEYKQKINR